MPRIRAATIYEHKALIRSELLEAARNLIAHEESIEVSLGEVALSAGVGRTTFYEYFTDRDDLIASLVEEDLPVILRDLIDSVGPSLTIPERLALLATRTIEFVATDPVFGVILHREAGRMGVDAQRRIRESHSQLSAEMTGIYVDGVAGGLFRAMPVPVAGRLIQDTIMSGARLLISGVATPSEVVGHVRPFLLGGLGHQSLTTP